MSAFENFLRDLGREELLPLFELYCQELVRWNRAKKLTAITERAEVYDRHFLDSVHGVDGLLPQGALVIDIGCGAGFPGLPLKMLRPDIHLIAVDSISKKIAFVRHMARKLGLQGVECFDRRAEELTQLHAKADVVTFRAVADSALLVKIGLPFLKQTGKLLLWKTKREVPEAEQVAGRTGLQMTFHATPFGEETGILELSYAR
ncbi:methyltransferase GidB [Desulfurispirillum indicum S5]|uniref:Ribosomal RNA small subunit methyltransferase G n=1 Tax=Desulfurispirillum indicum (strain ATCC BAA-1389 / DSM 22839 / S5) TaxID=653733 RepID=E6W5F5_DESIS|nr:16S rRNA (guanine(527)-N(7))-methyltransferase RsmG [Desulfurispirillum indicum]ADU64886.1 methyltransferase GidB [Desulfurispirillum indicum S5]